MKKPEEKRSTNMFQSHRGQRSTCKIASDSLGTTNFPESDDDDKDGKAVRTLL